MEQKEIRDYNNQRYSKEEGAEIIKELDDRTKSNLEGYNSIAEIGTHTKELQERFEALNTEGIKTYQTLADLPDPSVLEDGIAAKVANDPNASNNGYYAVVSGSWVKDTDLYENEVEPTNNSKGVTGLAVDTYTKEKLKQVSKSYNGIFVNNVPPEIDNFVKNIKIIGYSGVNTIFLSVVKRAFSGNQYRVYLSERPNEISTDNNGYISSFFKNNYIEPTNGLETITLKEFGSSGVTALITVDWNALPLGFSFENNTSMLLEINRAFIVGVRRVGNSFIENINANEKTIENLGTPFKLTSPARISDLSKSTTKDIGILELQQPTAEINHIPIYGQSLSTGQQTAPSLTRINFKGNLMLGDEVTFRNNANSFTPLISTADNGDSYAVQEAYQPNNQTSCEVPVTAAVNHLKEMFDKNVLEIVDRKFLATSSGTGGKTIEQLSKECTNPNNALYQNYLNTITKAKSIADADSKSIVCPAILFMQGEYNYTTSISGQEKPGLTVGSNATFDKDTYKDLLKTLADNMIDDVMAVYGQEKKPAFIIYQTANQYTRVNCSIGMAQLEASLEHDYIFLAAPVYFPTDRGGHLCANGSRWFGEMLGKVTSKILLKNEDWKPLYPEKIIHSDNTVLIKFHVPQGNLVFDTWTSTSKNNYGFEIFNDDVSVAINSVKLNGCYVEITTTNKLTGDVFVQYAGETMQGHGNLRDSDTYRSLYTYEQLPNQLKPSNEPLDELGGSVIYNNKYPMFNWCVQFHKQSINV